MKPFYLAALLLAGALAFAEELAAPAPPETPVAPAVQPAAAPEPETPPRPPHWATSASRPGLRNCYKVSDALYRGAQPTADGFRQLHDMGIKTIVSLRFLNSDREEIGETVLAYDRIRMKAWHPEEEDVVRFLQIVSDKQRQPIFVHCQHGADRTGTMCAVYRVVVQGWTKEEAVKEMTEGGYGFHGVFQDLVRYINSLDVERIKRKAGLK